MRLPGWLPRISRWRYYVMWSVVQTIGRMPISWRYGIAKFGCDRIYNWGPNIGNNVRDNVRHVLGPDAPDDEVDRVARQCMRNTGRYYADVIGMHRMNIQKFWNEDMRIDGVDYIHEAQARGQGVLSAISIMRW